jgi:hypothetical protein
MADVLAGTQDGPSKRTSNFRSKEDRIWIFHCVLFYLGDYLVGRI